MNLNWKITAIVLAIIMALILVGLFIVQPITSNYIAKQQTLGYQYGIVSMTNAMLDSIARDGYVQLNFGNQSLILVPYNPANSGVQ